MKKDTTLTEAELQQLRSDLQKVCGDQYSLQIIKTQRIGDIHLVVITYPEDAEDTFLDYRDEVPNSPYYFPYESSVGQLHYGNILPIVEKFKENLRVMYTCKNHFVLFIDYVTNIFNWHRMFNVQAYTRHCNPWACFFYECDDIREFITLITESKDLWF